FLLLGEPFHGTDRPYGLDRLRFVPLLELSFAPNRLSCSRAARLSAGYSSRRRNTARRKRSLPFTPHVVHTEKSLSSVALLAVSQLCTIRSKRSGRSFSR